jgi:hypothetical protein
VWEREARARAKDTDLGLGREHLRSTGRESTHSTCRVIASDAASYRTGTWQDDPMALTRQQQLEMENTLQITTANSTGDFRCWHVEVTRCNYGRTMKRLASDYSSTTRHSRMCLVRSYGSPAALRPANLIQTDEPHVNGAYFLDDQNSMAVPAARPAWLKRILKAVTLNSQGPRRPAIPRRTYCIEMPLSNTAAAGVTSYCDDDDDDDVFCC